jgi:hypothetical protein
VAAGAGFPSAGECGPFAPYCSPDVPDLNYNAAMIAKVAGFIVLPFALLLAATSGPALVAEKSPVASGQKPSATPTASSANEEAWTPVGAICRHLGLSPKCPALPPDIKVSALIATVPDPHRTDLPLYFDRTIDSLLWAAADSRYKFEAHRLPWSTMTSGSSISVGLALEDTHTGERTATLSDDTKDRGSVDQPGVLLFRRDWNQLLVILLVGETVTGGVNLPSFYSALKYVKEIKQQDVWIVGPTFSGTFDSLRWALNHSDAAPPASRIHITTGTATHRHSKQPDIPDVDVRAVIENDAFAFHAFYDYLLSRWGNPGEIVLLAEDQTAYGRLGEQQLAKVIQKDEYADQQWLFMRFPYGIARLRNSYERETAAATLANEKSGSSQPPPAQNLPFSLSSPEDDRDTVPALSKVQSPISQEAVLLNISGQLAREQAQYVGIVATDVLDAVFLARFLRKACPDVRIFMFDADLLFARAELNTPLEGILSITTYPLFGRNQHWTQADLQGEPPRRTAFASRYAEGEYNAARYALWNMEQPPAAAPPTAAEIMLDYRRPDKRYENENKPPLWLTVLGSDGYWPVALLDKALTKENSGEGSSLVAAPLGSQKEEEHHPEPPSPPRSRVPERARAQEEEMHPEPPSRLWSLIVALTAGIGVLHSLYIWLVYLNPKHRRAIGKWTRVFLYRFFGAYPRATAESAGGGADLRSEALTCPRLLLVATLVLSCVQIVSATSGIPYVFRIGPKPWVDYLYLCAPFVCFLVLVATAVRVTLCRGAHIVLGFLGWFGWALFCGMWMWVLRGYSDDEQSVFFFAYRMSHPTNGVSPAVPVLLLLGAVFAWALMLLARRAAVPPPALPALGEASRLAMRLNRRLSAVAPPSSLILALAGILLWGFLFHALERLRSVEGRTFDFLIRFLLALCYGLLFATWGQLLNGWTYFRRFLESLERHPMREAFSRVPKELAALPLFQREPQKVDLFTSARCSDTSDALLVELGAEHFAMGFAKRVAIIHFWMCKSQRQLAAGLREQPAAYGKVSAVDHQLEQTVLATANDLVHWAREDFWQHGASASLGRAEKGNPHRPLEGAERKRVLAEEFIALRLVMYIRHVLRQMRSLLWFMVIDFILTVLTLSSYTFQSRRLIAVCCVGALIIVGAGFTVVFAQMDRDPLLSRLSASKRNKLGMPFYLRLASFGALPLLTVLATQFPSIGRLLSGWVQPALEALR